MRQTSIAFSLIGLLTASVPASASDSGFKEFKSWQVLCGQTLSCSMRQFISGGEIGQVELRRDGGPEAPVLLILLPNDSTLTEGNPTAVLTIDGGEETRLDGDTESGMITLSADFIGSNFISALKNGTTLAIAITSGGKTAKAEIGLSGAAASLLFIDEYQKRIGHTDAMSAKGDKAPNPAPAIVDIRKFSDFPESLRSHFAEGGECADTEQTMLDGNAFAHTLSEETVLYVTPCGMGGAYNMAFAVFVENYGTVTSLAFPVMQDGAPSAMGHAYNLAYDYETRRFSAFFKGRGVGDCGAVNEWAVTENAGGPALSLIEESFRDCPTEFDENAEIDPANWPKTWPLK